MTRDQNKTVKKDQNKASKKRDEARTRRKNNEDSSDDDGFYSSESESDEMDQHEYRKFLAKMFPSKHAKDNVKAGEKLKLEIGSTGVRKEFNFAGDIVEAIWTLVNQDQITECVIGSGASYSIREWIESCFSIVELEWEDHVILLDKFVPEYQNLVSSPDLIRSIGWDPQISFENLSQRMMSPDI